MPILSRLSNGLFLLLGLMACWSPSSPQAEITDLEQSFQEALQFMDEGNDAAAENILVQLYELAPELPGIGMNLAVIEERKGNPEQAIVYLRAVLEHSPDHPPALTKLTALTGNATHHTKAEQLRSKIIDVRAEDYYQHYREKAEIVNTEYVQYPIRIKGTVAAIDHQRNLIFLRGASDRLEESVICVGAKSLLNSVEVGDEVSFIGTSPGVSKDTPKPIIVFQSLEE